MLKPTQEHELIKDRRAFRKALVTWFQKNGKDYPWRRTSDPYAILVSEVMLQQTQISTVLGKRFYQRFLEVFPTVDVLAEAGDEALLKAWEGLGYYRRARMLRDTARAIMENDAGVFPQELDALLVLPGIGRYTAGAVRSFAYDRAAPIVDGNIARVFSRLMDFRTEIDSTDGIKQLWKWAEELVDPENPRFYNSALMELGQTFCRPGMPDCLQCPVSKFCATRSPETLPVKRKKTEITEVVEHALWVKDSAGRVLLHREGGKRREGLWRLPVRSLERLSGVPIVTTHRYSITRYRVILMVHHGEFSSDWREAGDEWKDISEVQTLPMAAPFRVVVEKLLSEM